MKRKVDLQLRSERANKAEDHGREERCNKRNKEEEKEEEVVAVDDGDGDGDADLNPR